MATDQKSHVLAAASRTRFGALQEEEVYGTLGALLGTLEVVATDDAAPLTQVQAERLRAAVQLCHGLQHQLEALLTLADAELGERLRKNHVAVRPLIEHAVRGAVRGFSARAVELTMPEGEDWGQQRVHIDSSRVDRMLKALAEVLAASVGQGGSVEVAIGASASHVAITLSGQPGTPLSSKLMHAQPTLAHSVALTRGAARLFELHGGGFSVDVPRLVLQVLLPRSEAP